MYLDDVPVNYLAVLIAAVVFYILGAIWYLPGLFGKSCFNSEECCSAESKECCTPGETKKSCGCKAGAYIGEFFICLVIAYVLSLFITVSQADEVIEGIAVAVWAWLGFIATTHLSAVLWKMKPFKVYLINAAFLLLGFILMGGIIAYMGV
jgi:multidrug transporter EmrE-like cation transporter